MSMTRLKNEGERKKKGKVKRVLALAMVCTFLAGQSAWAQESNLKETGYQTGDLNDDGSIDLLDLMMCLNHVAKKNELAENAYLAADVNEDGKVDLLDLMQILNYVSKKITEFSGSSDQHTHSYTSTVTKEATCAEEGIMTYTCTKCGDSHTEAIPATGEHNWEHHDATGHTEQILVKEAYDETVYEEHTICNTCGEDFGTGADGSEKAGVHLAVSDDCQNYSTKSVLVTIHHDAVYEEKWIQDSAAYDKCTICGVTK